LTSTSKPLFSHPQNCFSTMKKTNNAARKLCGTELARRPFTQITLAQPLKKNPAKQPVTTGRGFDGNLLTQTKTDYHANSFQFNST
jgi:hypothetical protein